MRRIKKVGKKINIETRKIGSAVFSITSVSGASNLKKYMNISVIKAPKK